MDGRMSLHSLGCRVLGCSGMDERCCGRAALGPSRVKRVAAAAGDRYRSCVAGRLRCQPPRLSTTLRSMSMRRALTGTSGIPAVGVVPPLPVEAALMRLYLESAIQCSPTPSRGRLAPGAATSRGDRSPRCLPRPSRDPCPRDPCREAGSRHRQAGCQPSGAVPLSVVSVTSPTCLVQRRWACRKRYACCGASSNARGRAMSPDVHSCAIAQWLNRV